MANKDNPNGFLPWNNVANRGGQPVVEEFDLASANTEIGRGTPVTWSSGVIDIGGTSGALAGVAAEYKEASSGGKIAVWSDPKQRFVAQVDDDSSGTMTSVDGIGLNTDLVGTGVTGHKSDAELDESKGATTATLQFRVLKLSPEYTGDGGVLNAYGTNNRFIVKINNHQFAGGTGTAGT